MTRPEGFLPTSDAVPFAFEVRATMPGKTAPHHLIALVTITAAAASEKPLPEIVQDRMALAALSLMERYRAAQEAECPSP